VTYIQRLQDQGTKTS